MARRATQCLGEVRHGRDPDAAGDQERALDAQIEAVAERSEDVDPRSGLERAERARPRADRLHQEPELPRRRLAEAHGARQHATGHLEHEELTRHARVEAAALQAEQRVRADRVTPEDGQRLAARVHRPVFER